ncbi:MAG: ABC transporter transmembrane domain-containing protein [Oscillospiraceae bacterium]
MLKLGRYLKDFKKEVILGPLFKLMEAIFELLVPLVMARIIDVGIAPRHRLCAANGRLMVLLGVVGLVCALTCQYYAAKASQGFGTIVRRKLYAHINALSHAEVDRIGTASLITRLTGDVN